jgi:hypothetical protein
MRGAARGGIVITPLELRIDFETGIEIEVSLMSLNRMLGTTRKQYLEISSYCA